MKTPVREFFQSEVMSYSALFDGGKSGVAFNFSQRSAIVAEFASGRSGPFLDCATGSGEVANAALLAAGSSCATLLDISPSMLERAQRLFKNSDKIRGEAEVRFIEADTFAWLAEAAARGLFFETVLCVGLIAHTGCLDELLGLISKVLKPGQGRVILQTTLSHHPGTVVVRMLTAKRYKKAKGYKISYYTSEDILRATRNAGLKLTCKRLFGLGIPFGDRLHAGLNYRLEKAFVSATRVVGSEAIFVLSR